jgi:hypothetical protein
MVNVEPYNAIAEADGMANTLVDFYSFDKLPVFMAATSEFVEKNPDTIVAYLKAWLEVAKGFKNEPAKVAVALAKRGVVLLGGRTIRRNTIAGSFIQSRRCSAKDPTLSSVSRCSRVASSLYSTAGPRAD